MVDITKQHHTKKGPGHGPTFDNLVNSPAGTKVARQAKSGICTVRGKVRHVKKGR